MHFAFLTRKYLLHKINIFLYLPSITDHVSDPAAQSSP